MRERTVIRRFLVALEALQIAMCAFAILAAINICESGVPERRAQGPLVVEKLMTPAAKRAIEREARLHFFVIGHAEAIVRDPDPVEIGSRQSQDAVIAENAAAFT